MICTMIPSLILKSKIPTLLFYDHDRVYHRCNKRIQVNLLCFFKTEPRFHNKH